jgi:hypothetical protein
MEYDFWDAVWVAVRAHAIADSPRAPFDSRFACIYSYELCAVKCFALRSRGIPARACLPCVYRDAALPCIYSLIVLCRIGLPQPWYLCLLVLMPAAAGWVMHGLLGLVIPGAYQCASAAASLADIDINLRRLIH